MLKIYGRKWPEFDETDQVAGLYDGGCFIEVYRNKQGTYLVIGRGVRTSRALTGVQVDAEGLSVAIQKCVTTNRLPDGWVNPLLEKAVNHKFDAVEVR